MIRGLNFTIAIILITNFVFAQEWKLVGNAPGGTDFLGTTNSQDLRIKTEGAQNINFYTNTGAGSLSNQRAIITSSGNFGIGTTNPTAIIGINGDAAQTIQMEQPTTASTSGYDFTVKAGYSSTGSNLNGGNLVLSSGKSTGNGNSQIQFWTAPEGGSGSTARNPTQKVVILGSGRTGIGTSSPLVLLHQHVGSADNNYHQFTTSTSTQASINDGFRIGITENAGVADAEIRQGENAPMRLYTNGTERVTIAAGGNIGAGITTPQNLVHINNASANSSVFYQVTTSNTAAASATDGFTMGLKYNSGVTNAELSLGESTGNINFLTGSTPTQKMTILNGGKVGIGTTPGSNGWLEVKTDNSTTPIYAVYAENNNATSTSGTIGAIDASCTIARTGSNANIGVNITANGSDYYNYGVDTRVNYIGAEYNIGGHFHANRGDVNEGIFAEASNDGVGGTAVNNKGVISFARDASTSNKAFFGEASGAATNNYGIDVTAGGATTNYGINALASQTSSTNYGGYGKAQGASSTNYGLYGTANSGTQNYGVYGKVLTGTCGTGSSSGCPDAAGFFEGDVFCTTNSYFVSDANIKTNIAPLTNGLSIINQLQPHSYLFDTLAAPGLTLPVGTQYGLLAQELELLLPSLVKETKNAPTIDSNGIVVVNAVQVKGINYVSLIPFLIGAIQEQQSLIQLQGSRIDSLVAVIGNGALRSPGSQNNSGNQNGLLKVSLSSNQSGILYQNEPNPFSNQTRINYFIPENTGKAALNFYNNMGTVIKSVIISQKGQGTVEVETANLNSAIYTYSLTIDGQVIDTKRMVKTK